MHPDGIIPHREAGLPCRCSAPAALTSALAGKEWCTAKDIEQANKNLTPEELDAVAGGWTDESGDRSVSSATAHKPAIAMQLQTSFYNPHQKAGHEMNDMNRHKDSDPKETVERIKGILAELDVHPEGEVFDYAERFYSVRIVDEPTRMGTNGKGASADLARASAYGEYMERLENGMLILPLFTEAEAADLEGLTFWPDARTVSLDEACASYPAIMQEMVSNYMPRDVVEPGTENKDVGEVISFWRKPLRDQVSLAPYYCIGTKSCVELPDSLFAFHCTSNGLCSGNTPAEALVEGMSELCERYAKAKILYGELCPPRIDRAFIQEHCPVQAEMLSTIEKNSPSCNIIVFDASLGVGVPAVSIVFVDQERGAIRAKFGAHPSIAIAIERCMTEHFQGYDAVKSDMSPQDIHAYTFTAWDAWSRSTIRSLTISGPQTASDMGSVPNRILLNKPDWEFVPWGTDSFTNGQAVLGLAALLRTIGGEVYIRDNGFLGVPAYRIYVPHVSHVASIIGPCLSRTKEYGVQLGCALTAYGAGNYRLAADFLKMNNTRRDLCAAQELLCRDEGIPEHERDVLLEEYFGKGPAAYARNVWRSDDAEAALRAFNRRFCAFQNLGKTQSSKGAEKRSARACLARKLKAQKLANPIDQMRLDALFR